MNNFVMGKREDEVLVERIHGAKREFVMAIFAAVRVGREVLQCIVHESHVPLESEAQAADMGWPRNHRPGGGFFRKGLDVRISAINLAVQLSQEIDSGEVLRAAVLIGNPL